SGNRRGDPVQGDVAAIARGQSVDAHSGGHRVAPVTLVEVIIIFILRSRLMEWLFAPFEVSFVTRALWGGLLVSCLCALAGTWVVVRGMAFLSEAMAHGMLPGVAVAALIGGNVLGGAACSAAPMAVRP